MTTAAPQPARDQCYRCGYDIRGIANDQPCPECGLLAERSRRVTDDLHETRPRWLKSLSWGINLILLAICAPFIWERVPIRTLEFMLYPLFPWPLVDAIAPFLGDDAAVLLFLLGVIFLTRPEGYPAADRANRRLRMGLRMFAVVPILFVFLNQFCLNLIYQMLGQVYDWGWIVLSAGVLLAAPMPFLLFLHLRGIAGRARSAHLAEHCKIVGIGASLTIFALPIVDIVVRYARNFGLGENWDSRSTSALLIFTLIPTAIALFFLWTLYLLVRFAISFWIASRYRRSAWTRDDRSLVPPPGSTGAV